MRQAPLMRWVAIVAATLLLGFTNNQCLSRGDIYANANGAGLNLFTWLGTAPAWSGSTQIATYADFTANVKNNGACGGSSALGITYSAATACAVAGTGAAAHVLLANGSFASASFASWTADAAASLGCPNLFAATATDQDADGGGAFSSTGTSCDTNGASYATAGLNQTFSIAGTPTSQTWSLWYQAALVSAGDDINCIKNAGTVANLVVKVNGTTVGTLAAPRTDGVWHNFFGTTTAMVSGSNTVDVSVQISGASGQHLVLIGGQQYCRTVTASQLFFVDNVNLQATW